ncbi:hypothetical protein Acy02nite_88050 [Actinoplanes cyaneus]|uniref:Uncharacterized protein n=1 Tax=Actinoplanes cyaneus TaxID=52696 RepID=A0A919MCQ8_9ACTN|nr:hypothetical protein Acy02nite_88050 [Actinoplanes cyaneus]
MPVRADGDLAEPVEAGCQPDTVSRRGGQVALTVPDAEQGWVSLDNRTGRDPSHQICYRSTTNLIAMVGT